MKIWRVIARVFNIVAAIAATLVGLAVMIAWGAGVIAIYAAVLLKVLHVDSIFDTYFPGMTPTKWLVVAVVWSLVPASISWAGTALDALGEWRNNRIRRRTAERYAAGLIDTIKKGPQR